MHSGIAIESLTRGLAEQYKLLSPKDRRLVGTALLTLIFVLTGCRGNQELKIQDYCETNPNDPRFCDPETGAPLPTPAPPPTRPGSSPEATNTSIPEVINVGEEIVMPSGGTVYEISKNLIKSSYPPLPTPRYNADPVVHQEEWVRMVLAHYLADYIMLSNGYTDPTKIPAGAVLQLPSRTQLRELYNQALAEVLSRKQEYQSSNDVFPPDSLRLHALTRPEKAKV